MSLGLQNANNTLANISFVTVTVSCLVLFTDFVYIRKRFGFRPKLVTIDKCDAITSHIGRRSFASNFYGKIPTALLMDATGHATEQMFNRYISNFDTERAKLLSNYFEDNFNNLNA
ncbi:hypothetical protein [Myroides odoratus]|uniref:hypothetical protein n=1 Tax=Myroides odoratus TaxID=256 RepID=UPI000765BAC5|nr:hypothetical protein [Myroides odoratus]